MKTIRLEQEPPHGTIRLHVSNLKPGMFVAELDRPWLETPFLLEGFELQGQADVEEMQKYCEHVYVDRRFAAHATPTIVPTEAGVERIIDTEKPKLRMLERSLPNHVPAANVPARRTLSSSLDTILADPTAMLWLSRMRSHDQRLAEHSVNVTILALQLARHLNYQGDEVEQIGMCAMLHDVGKLKLESTLLHKETRTDEEEQAYRQHARQGYQLLASHKNIHASVATVAYTHQEAVDGSGYPRGLKGDKLLPFSKIVAICDAYDELTCAGRKGPGLSSQQALQQLANAAGSKYDQGYVEAFVQCISQHSPGTLVELFNGCIALVTSRSQADPGQSKILIVRDADKKSCSERSVTAARPDNNGSNGSKQRRSPLSVQQVLPNGAHRVRLEHYIQQGVQIF